MPTFEFTAPDGKTYEVEGPKGATKEQAFQILQSQLKGQSQPSTPSATNGFERFTTKPAGVRYDLGQPTGTDEPILPYAWNKAKEGFASIPGLVASGIDVASAPTRMAKKALGLPMMEMEKEDMPLTERFSLGAPEILGYDPHMPKPKDPWGKPKLSADILGNAAGFLGSSILPSAGVVAKSATPVKALAKEVAGSVLAGEGETMGEHMAPEGHEQVGGFVGSLTGPMAVQKGIDALVGSGNWVKKEAGKFGFTGLSEEARRRAGAEKAAKELAPQLSSPVSQQNIAEAGTIGQKIPGFSENLTLGRATDSPAIKSMEQHYGSTVREALGVATEKEKGLKSAIGSYAGKRFPEQVETAPNLGAQKAYTAKVERLDEGVTRLSEQERRLASTVSRMDMEDIGTQLRTVRGNLMDATKRASTVRYNRVYDAARENGLQVNMTDVQSLAGKINKDAGNAFQDDPGVIGKILGRYKEQPKPVQEFITTPTGKKIRRPMAPVEQPSKEVDFKEFHSLYKEANREASELAIAAKLGSGEAAQKLRSVNQVRDLLQKKITEMEGEQHGEVGKLLKDANKFYREKYAALFKQGVGGEIGKTNRFGFSTENAKIIPSLVFKKGDASGVREYMEMAQGDPKAYRLLENGVLDMFSKATVKDGVISKEALGSFLRNYKEPLAELPGIRSKIETVGRATVSLGANKKLIAQEQKQLAQSTLAKVAKSENTDALVAKSLKSPSTLQTVLNTAVTREEKESVARSFMEHVSKQADPLEFMSRNEKALTQALGKRQVGYLATIMNAEKIAGRTAAPTHLQFEKLGDPLSEKIGTSIPQALSEAKGVSMRFASREYAAVRVAVRWWNTLRNSKRDEILMDAIYNPDMAMALAKYMRNPGAKTASDANLHLMSYGVKAAAQAYRGEDEEKSRIESRQFGGPVSAGQPYMVGEAGPEVVVPNQSGTVVPNAGSSNAMRNVMNALVPSAGAAEMPKGRYYNKNGKIYDTGIEISREEAAGLVRRAQESLKRNDEQLAKAPADLKPIMAKAHALAKNKFEQEIKELLQSMSGLPSRQYGGNVSAGNAYLVGEQGPEIVLPNQPAQMSTNPQAANAMIRGGGQNQSATQQQLLAMLMSNKLAPNQMW